MFQLITAGLLGLLLPGTTAGPCEGVSVERVVAIFAEAGEPVKAGETAGFRMGEVEGFCTYEFRDATGALVRISVEINRLGDDFAACSPLGQSESFRTLHDLADAACSENPPHVELASIHFRHDKLAGKAMIIWERDGVQDVRMKVLTRVARAWAASLDPSPGTAPDACAALPIDRVAAIFAEAGEPVTAGGKTGFRKGEVERQCTYQVFDGTGVQAVILVEVKPLGTGGFTLCRSASWSDATRMLDDVADEGCSINIPHLRQASVHFRRDKLVGEATIVWERDGVTDVRAKILERFARAWVASADF